MWSKNTGCTLNNSYRRTVYLCTRSRWTTKHISDHIIIRLSSRLCPDPFIYTLAQFYNQAAAAHRIAVFVFSTISHHKSHFRHTVHTVQNTGQTWVDLAVNAVTSTCPSVYVVPPEVPMLCDRRHRYRHVTSSSLLPWQRGGGRGLAPVQLTPRPHRPARRQRSDISCEAAAADAADDWCGMRSGHSVTRLPDPECLVHSFQSQEMSTVKLCHQRHCNVTIK